MKKTFIAIAMLLGSTTISQAKLFGISIKIDYERGRRSLLPDGTVSDCYDRGCCKFKISADASATLPFTGFMENRDGTIVFVIPSAYVRTYQGDFSNGKYSINTDISVDAATASKMQANPFAIKSGEYNVTFDTNGDALVKLTSAR